MSPVEVLRAARELIADPKNHTTGYYARDANGRMVDSNDPEATCWCALGSIHHVVMRSTDPQHVVPLARKATELLYDVLPPSYRGLAALNDLGGHARVMQVFELGIQRGEMVA